MIIKNPEYHKQLSNAFFEKSGKSVCIPKIIETIENQIKKKNLIKILDVGCNRGTLFSIIKILSHENKWEDKIELYGLDYDTNSIKICSKKHPDCKLYELDLNQDSFNKSIQEKFDIIISINTIHEVFSTQLTNKRNIFNLKTYNKNKKSLKLVFKNISNLLNIGADFILYDGVDINIEKENNIEFFSLKPSFNKKLLQKFIKEYKPWKICIKEINDNLFSINTRDFLRLLSAIKYINTPFWTIEKEQTYHYFSKSDFIETSNELPLQISYINKMNNDISFWKQMISLKKNSSFPQKSILIVFQKI